MSFSGHQPYDPTAAATAREDFTIANDGFFPDITLSGFLLVERITDEYRTDTIRHALLLAMRQANRDLADTACQWLRVGWLTLADVPCAELGGDNLNLLLYREAVYAWAKCQLLQEYPTMNRKQEAANLGKEGEGRCPELMARYRDAIGQLQGDSGRLRCAAI